MIDVHTHILPGVDDGSEDEEMSLQMLKREDMQHIGSIFLTPHFYADMNDPDSFLEKRSRAMEKLQEKITSEGVEVPDLYMGAEVHYYRGIGRSEEVSKLCIGKSRFILIEPSFREWTPTIVDEIRELINQQDLKVIIAHIERYLDQDKRLVRELIEDPSVLIQSNAEFFLDRGTRRKALKMMKKGQIDLLGSDCHNLDTRVPCLRDAVELIEDELGPGVLDRVRYNNEMLLDEV